MIQKRVQLNYYQVITTGTYNKSLQ